MDDSATGASGRKVLSGDVALLPEDTDAIAKSKIDGACRFSWPSVESGTMSWLSENAGMTTITVSLYTPIQYQFKNNPWGVLSLANRHNCEQLPVFTLCRHGDSSYGVFVALVFQQLASVSLWLLSLSDPDDQNSLWS